MRRALHVVLALAVMIAVLVLAMWAGAGMRA